MDPTCFSLRPSSGSLQLSLAKVILILKHSVKLCRYLSCGGVAGCPGFAVRIVCCAEHMLEPSNFNVNFNQSSNKCASVGE